ELSLLACTNGSTSPTEAHGSVTFTTVIQFAVPGQNGDQLRVVVRDAATWARVWADLQAGSSLQDTPPAVDFSREMLVVAAMPTQSCVAKVSVRSIVRAGDGSLAVDVLEQPPAANCRCMTSERPFHVVSLARTDAQVRFSVEISPRSC